MKKLLILSALSITTLGFSQTNYEGLKKENEALHSTNKILTSENDYLKKIVEINKAILETEKDNSS
ncbi:MAG: transposase, partial [Cloacibacterium sp.]